MYDPKAIGPCAALLRSGLVAGHIFEPYESHVPFFLQFLADYGLSGMATLSLRKYRVCSVRSYLTNITVSPHTQTLRSNTGTSQEKMSIDMSS